jgi:hypothetical protein
MLEDLRLSCRAIIFLKGKIDGEGMVFEGNSCYIHPDRKPKTVGQQRFDRMVKSLARKLQPEYKSVMELKKSTALSTERRLQIIEKIKQGEFAAFDERERERESKSKNPLL